MRMMVWEAVKAGDRRTGQGGFRIRFKTDESFQVQDPTPPEVAAIMTARSRDLRYINDLFKRQKVAVNFIEFVYA